jgi:hypothetical protein
MQTATRQSFIWGTGLIHPSTGTGNPDPRRILAVRGKLTYAELLRNGVTPRDVPLGDPGILIPRLLAQNNAVPGRFRLGLVPHYFDRDHPFFLDASNDSSIKVLDVCQPPEIFFPEIASCEAIASTSLHGLIFGEALGIPTLWLEVSDKVIGQGFKFADWFSLARNPQREPVHPEAFVSTAAIIRACEPRQIEIDSTALLEAIVPEILEECSVTEQPLRRTVIPVSVCRVRPLPIFILLCNNADHLLRMISSCQRQHRTVETVIYDDGGHDAKTLAVLSGLESDGVSIYHRHSDDPPELWQRLNNALRAHFRDWAEPSRYAVTGCGQQFGAVGAGALDLYDDLLDRFPRADSVGPAIVDLPSDQPLVETIVNGRTAPGNAATAPYPCVVVDGGIELGFAVYRAGKPLQARMKSLRVSDPH